MSADLQEPARPVDACAIDACCANGHSCDVAPYVCHNDHDAES